MGQMPMGQMPMGQMGGLFMNPTMEHVRIPPVLGPGQEGVMTSSFPKGSSNTIVIGTDQEDFMKDGISMGGFGPMMPRAPRRNPFRSQMGAMMPSYSPSTTSSGGTSPSFTITKLE